MDFIDIIDASYIKLEKQVSLKLRCDIIRIMINDNNISYVIHDDTMKQLHADIINER